jgi:hypothetical protein
VTPCVNRCAPDGGLADPGITLEHECGRAVGEQVEELIHSLLLVLSSDDFQRIRSCSMAALVVRV